MRLPSTFYKIGEEKLKNSNVLPAILVLVLVLLALPSCKKNPGIDPDLTADFTAEIQIGFELIWPPNSTLPSGIDYKISITLTETAGLFARIVSVTAKFTDSKSKSMSYSYSGTQLFGTDQIEGNQTLTSTRYTQNIPFTDLNAAQTVEINITLKDINDHLISKDYTVKMNWGN
jgi:hypothetical protein